MASILQDNCKYRRSMKSNLNAFPVPDICRNSNILVIILVVELISIAICLSLVGGDFVVQLGIVSLYVQWWVLIALVLLCQLRSFISTLRWWRGAVVVGVLLYLPFISVELAYQFYIDGSSQVGWFNAQRLFENSVAAIIVILILMRLMVLAANVERWNQAEAESRIQALQARIQPHFLFNSLNTISELAATGSDKAEEAIQALSMLFRVSLEEGSNFHSLDKEVRLCERYIQLEMWRVEDWVEIVWDVVVDEAAEVIVPKLILQPLVENAIKYSGKNASIGRKTKIRISVKESLEDISIKVTNPIVTSLDKPKPGNGIALNNIRERLFVLYDDRQSFNVRSDSTQYQVLMTLPKKMSS